MKLVITRWKQGILTMLTGDDRELEFLYETTGEPVVGDIIIARVKDIVKNINAAFVEIAPGVTCYLSLEDAVRPVYINCIHKNNRKLVQGDEILVQIIKNRMKTKDAVVTTNLSFTGRYVVLTTGNQRLGVSMKLEDERRHQLKQAMKDAVPEHTGVVIRTNAADASINEILNELHTMEERKNQIIETAKHRTCFSVMQHAPEKYIQLLRDLKSDRIEKIITDDQMIFDSIQEYLSTNTETVSDVPLILYQDSMQPLYKLYSIETRLENAMSKRVWLKSGGYLIIEPTEALTVIDVNTGKYAGKKNSQETFMKINTEAAEEIAHQLRLRNISGIIIVDFINMESKEYQKALMTHLADLVKKDRMKTDVLDMTGLHLVEMTRKKVDRSIYEFFV